MHQEILSKVLLYEASTHALKHLIEAIGHDSVVIYIAQTGARLFESVGSPIKLAVVFKQESVFFVSDHCGMAIDPLLNSEGVECDIILVLILAVFTLGLQAD